jgi:hypothetical protein
MLLFAFTFKSTVTEPVSVAVDSASVTENPFKLKKSRETGPGTISSDEGTVSGDSVLYFLDGEVIGDGAAFSALGLDADDILRIDVKKDDAALEVLGEQATNKYKVVMYVHTKKAEQAERVISGTITDAVSGKPLPGTNILIKGTTTGTVSNLEGYFKLNNPADETILIVKFIGYQ